MYSPALFSAVLLFAASAFSMPADNAGYDPSEGGKADSAPDKPYCAKYTPQTGETCASVAGKYKLDVAEFMKWNPTIDKECKHMNAGTAYCITKPNTKGSKSGQKGHSGGRKSGKKAPTGEQYQDSQTDGSGNGVVNHGEYSPGDDPPGRSPVQCNSWYQAQQGDTCVSIAKDKRISWNDFLEWNSFNHTDAYGVRVCPKIKPGNSYCVGQPTSFRAIGYYHTDCTGQITQDISVPPGAGHHDGVCIDTNCNIGSLLIPPKLAGQLGCPPENVQISYYEMPGCNKGLWFGYGYDSQPAEGAKTPGNCHHLWGDGWATRSLHLRCAPKKNDCTMRPEYSCSFAGLPQTPTCKQSGVLAAST